MARLEGLQSAAMLTLLAALLILLTTPAAQSPARLTADEAYELGTQAYLYAYPLVLMERTRAATPNRPLNQFVHAPAYPGPEARVVIRPNVDTLYSTAWLDLSREPVLMTVPDMGDRYYLIQLLDVWTETFSVPGTRTTGNKAGTFAIVGPDWKGTLPPGVTRIDSPTNIVWIIGRIQTNGPADYANVRALQRGFSLAPLSGSRSAAPTPAASDSNPSARITPPAAVAQQDAAAFFAAFADALRMNRPHAEDAAFVARLKAIGIVPGQPFDRSSMAPAVMQALDRAVNDAQKQLPRLNATVRNGWRYINTVGRYGTSYQDRASIARFGLGALPTEDAIYVGRNQDADGKPFTGASHYTMHFAKDALPPVRAFWSLTLYDADGYFAPNAINRYAIGDRDKLTFNADGSLDLHLQHDRPADGLVANWLPTPEGAFNLTMRLYWPKPAALSGTWTPPVVRQTP
jgi:hypothetical protein